MGPLLNLGQRSYEVYLTHMFVVFGLFQPFVLGGKPMMGVPALFISVVLIASLLGEGVARFYSEPMNYLIRELWGSATNGRLSASVSDFGQKQFGSNPNKSESVGAARQDG
jgi:peptidoglycan/LPS O-acetylase OafA/YrhL